jgi:hypothetical protein
MWVASVYCGYLLLRSLLTFEPSMLIGLVLFCFAPSMVWLAFKTLPECPAMFFLALSILSLVRSLEHSSLRWTILGATALACLALTRNAFALGFAAFATSLVLFGGYRYPLKRVATNTLSIGILSLGIFAAMLIALGIPLAAYLWIFSLAMGEVTPILVRLYFTTLEGGVLFLALPMALSYRPRKEALFFLAWFVLSTVPVYLLLADIETRYLMANLLPLMGLVLCSAKISSSWLCSDATKDSGVFRPHSRCT